MARDVFDPCREGFVRRTCSRVDRAGPMPSPPRDRPLAARQVEVALEVTLDDLRFRVAQDEVVRVEEAAQVDRRGFGRRWYGPAPKRLSSIAASGSTGRAGRPRASSPRVQHARHLRDDGTLGPAWWSVLAVQARSTRGREWSSPRRPRRTGRSQLVCFWFRQGSHDVDADDLANERRRGAPAPVPRRAHAPRVTAATRSLLILLLRPSSWPTTRSGLPAEGRSHAGARLCKNVGFRRAHRAPPSMRLKLLICS